MQPNCIIALVIFFFSIVLSRLFFSFSWSPNNPPPPPSSLFLASLSLSSGFFFEMDTPIIECVWRHVMLWRGAIVSVSPRYEGRRLIGFCFCFFVFFRVTYYRQRPMAESLLFFGVNDDFLPSIVGLVCFVFPIFPKD
ncbi:hypothetical protein F4861DRAFT_406410 [Xylaria intraflava]|nr:hypothetical protein F4861DRAFT_406410 [Xylaria intraflava]